MQRLLRRDADRVPGPAQRADRAAPRRRRGDRRGDALRHPPAARSAACRPTGRAFEMRFCAMFLFEEDRARLRARLLRRRHDPAPARHRPRPADAAGPRGDRAQPSADGRPGGGRRAAATVSRACGRGRSPRARRRGGAVARRRRAGRRLRLRDRDRGRASPRRAALVVESPGSEQIVLSLDLASDGGGRAAVVLPVPGVPDGRGDRARRPARLPGRGDGSRRRRSASAGGGARRRRRRAAGRRDRPRDGRRLRRRPAGGRRRAGARRAGSTTTATRFPTGAEPILADYVDEGWRFVAIRLAPEARGPAEAAAVSFATDEPVYPMRLAQLATEPVNLTLYTLADGRAGRRARRRRTRRRSPSSIRQPPPELAELFAQGSR